MSKICSPVSTDLFVCIVHCEPFPLPLAAIHIVMRGEKIFSNQVLGKFSTVVGIQLQKRHSGAVDQSRDDMGEDMSSNPIHVGFFFS